jgi:hypothetical protein
MRTKVEGVEYSPEAVDSIRDVIIELRNAALTVPDFHRAVALSHALAYLADYREVLQHEMG